MKRFKGLIALILFLSACSPSDAAASAATAVLFGANCARISTPTGGSYNATTITGWSVGNATIVVSPKLVSPNCTYDAQQTFEGIANASHEVNITSGPALTVKAWTFSFYVKRVVGSRNVAAQFFSTGFADGGGYAFDLNVCATTPGGAFNYGLFGTATGTATPVAGGWCKVSVTITTGIAASSILQIEPLIGSTSTYTGDGISSLALWGIDFR